MGGSRREKFKGTRSPIKYRGILTNFSFLKLQK